jgi:hypothetical protein
MLYTSNLEEIIFQRHEILESDELIVLSGYVGPKPINRLNDLPIHSTVIYGMYGSEGIQSALHNSLLQIKNYSDNINIFYSQLPVHSKCYAWRSCGEITYALIGSANFSINGLNTPFREMLGETTKDSFKPLNEYLKHILSNCISCLEVDEVMIQDEPVFTNICSMSLLMPSGRVHNASGLNWGYMKNGLPSAKRGIDDACIPIRVEHVRRFPDLFPPKLTTSELKDSRGRRQRDNEAIEIIWDDGTTMEGLLEGTQPIDGVKYPKQISSFPDKSELGEYIRNRLGVPLRQPVRTHHLVTYGRPDINVSLLGTGVYRFDFSV